MADTERGKTSRAGISVFAFWLSVWGGVAALVCAFVATSKQYSLHSAEVAFSAALILFIAVEALALIVGFVGFLLAKPRRIERLIQTLISVFALSVVFAFVLKRAGLL
ncbi:MAG: hypothetical protein DRP63_04055 [Planctomycetota bacterium]|nr:MAG: hypothetical protein DRP63_04055 [Planctomycetota bacterium]